MNWVTIIIKIFKEENEIIQSNDKLINYLISHKSICRWAYPLLLIILHNMNFSARSDDLRLRLRRRRRSMAIVDRKWRSSRFSVAVIGRNLSGKPKTGPKGAEEAASFVFSSLLGGCSHGMREREREGGGGRGISCMKGFSLYLWLNTFCPPRFSFFDFFCLLSFLWHKYNVVRVLMLCKWFYWIGKLKYINEIVCGIWLNNELFIIV